MSDTVLKGDALTPLRRRSGASPWYRRLRLRLKRLGDAMADYVAEVFMEMERGRQMRPVISAYHQPRRR